jgi:hypothetical protein
MARHVQSFHDLLEWSDVRTMVHTPGAVDYRKPIHPQNEGLQSSVEL